MILKFSDIFLKIPNATFHLIDQDKAQRRQVEGQQSERGGFPKKACGASRRAGQPRQHEAMGLREGRESGKGLERVSEAKVLESNYLPASNCGPYFCRLPTHNLGQATQRATCRRHQAGSPSTLYYLGCGLFQFPNGCMGSCPWKNS